MYVLTHISNEENLEPKVFFTKEDMTNGLKEKLVEIIKANLDNLWVSEPLPEDTDEIIEYAIVHDCIEKLSETEYKCFDSDTIKAFEIEGNDRLEELLISAFEWAIDVSEQQTHDLLRATGITSEELEEIGYDKQNYKKMHNWIKE